MFQGSENYNDEFFEPFELVGATDQNGTTNYDRTNYFQNVPTTALDLALWLESDRMGHLLGVIDQARLDEQRGVVQNEKRQGENQPYGRVWERLAAFELSRRAPVPAQRDRLMDDLDAASLEDVKTWFQTYYGPANAVLVLAGDIDLATAKDKVTRYFGDIPAGPPLTRDRAWVAPRIASSRDTMQDRVAQPLVIDGVWNVPGAGTADADLLDLAAQVLGGSAASRLDERLVHVEQHRRQRLDLRTTARSWAASSCCRRRSRPRWTRPWSSARSTRNSRACSPKARPRPSSAARQDRVPRRLRARHRAHRRLRRQGRHPRRSATPSPASPIAIASPWPGSRRRRRPRSRPCSSAGSRRATTR